MVTRYTIRKGFNYYLQSEFCELIQYAKKYDVYDSLCARQDGRVSGMISALFLTGKISDYEYDHYWKLKDRILRIKSL